MCKSLHHKKQKVLGTIYLKSVSTTITRDSYSPRTRPNEVTCRRTTRKPGKYQLATWNRRPKHQRGRVPLEKGLLVLVEREKSRQTKKYEKNRLVQKLPVVVVVVISSSQNCLQTTKSWDCARRNRRRTLVARSTQNRTARWFETRGRTN